MKKYIALIIIVLLFWPLMSFAMVSDTNPNYFAFDLTYSNGVLKPSSLNSVPYRFIYESMGVLEGRYNAELFDTQSKTIQTFKYNLNDGPNIIYVPFYSNAGVVKFSDLNNKLLFQYDLSSISTCNVNKVCESNIGEDYSSCPTDCKISEKIVTPESYQADQNNKKIIIILVIVTGLVTLITIGVAVYLIKFRTR